MVSLEIKFSKSDLEKLMNIPDLYSILSRGHNDYILYPKKRGRFFGQRNEIEDFWDGHRLVKFLADDKDEDSQEVFVYSIEVKNGGIPVDSFFDKKWKDYMPKHIFEEVGDNIYQLINEDEEIPDCIEVVTK